MAIKLWEEEFYSVNFSTNVPLIIKAQDYWLSVKTIVSAWFVFCVFCSYSVHFTVHARRQPVHAVLSQTPCCSWKKLQYNIVILLHYRLSLETHSGEKKDTINAWKWYCPFLIITISIVVSVERYTDNGLLWDLAPTNIYKEDVTKKPWLCVDILYFLALPNNYYTICRCFGHADDYITPQSDK